MGQMLVFYLLWLVWCFGEASSSSSFLQREKDASYWYEKGKNALNTAKTLNRIDRRAKNVILFLGDGMSTTTLTAARILKGQQKGQPGEEGHLFFEGFPFMSLIKAIPLNTRQTYNLNKQVPDSAGTATAFMCGVKANYETIGVNGHIAVGNTDCEAIRKNSVPSLLQWALDAGKSAGVVTTTRITHATPAASYAHSASRYWENDAKLPPEARGQCKDIGRQLIEDEPGSKLKVILGGGRKHLLSSYHRDPKSNEPGLRKDGRDLIEEWSTLRKREELPENKYKFVNSSRGLRDIDLDHVDYLFGAFAFDHCPYDVERDMTIDGEPSLEEMTATAIKVLKKNEDGFVLLVEGGRIDHAHHDNFAAMSLLETLSFEKSIEAALKLVSSEDTLIAVTADHAHTLTINGYPPRGQSIFGFGDINETKNNFPYTVLMYGNGPGNQSPRPDPLLNKTDAPRYRQHSAVNLEESAHGGEDVALYAVGPMAHLFHGLQEQSYVAHVLSYAACIGDYRNQEHCVRASASSSGKPHFLFPFLLLLINVGILSKPTDS